MRGNPRDIGHERSVIAYADDTTIIVTELQHLQCVGEAIKDYEAVTGAKINQLKLLALQFGTWRGKSTPYNKVMRRWADGTLKMLGSLVLLRAPK